MLIAKDWETFQSYKDRSPPWIRLHKRLLDNYQFQKMSVEARALLPMLWLLVSEDSDPTSGRLRIGYEEIAFRLRQCEESVTKAIHEIIKAGFFEETEHKEKSVNTNSYESVTEPLRNCHSETETETEKRQIYVEAFNLFWQKYPKQRAGNKAKAYTAFCKALKESTEKEIMDGLEAYIRSDEVLRGFAKGAAGWLNDDRWKNDYRKPQTGFAPKEQRYPEIKKNVVIV